MKGFRWMCFGLAIHFLLVAVFMLVTFPGLTKFYALAPIPASPFFFWGFYMIGKRIKQEAVREARETEEKQLEERCLADYQNHRQKNKKTPRIFN